MTNRAAVLFEQGKFDECIKVRRAAAPPQAQAVTPVAHAQDCDDAVEKGHETRADFKARARLHPRPARILTRSIDAGARYGAQGQRAAEEG